MLPGGGGRVMLASGGVGWARKSGCPRLSSLLQQRGCSDAVGCVVYALSLWVLAPYYPCPRPAPAAPQSKVPVEPGMPPAGDEHVLCDDNRFIADLAYDFKQAKAKDGAASKLLFKKRMFRETDETVTEPQFVNLSYIQAQHDYLQVRAELYCTPLLRSGYRLWGAVLIGRRRRLEIEIA